jgi:hypothetical protein
VRAADAGIPLGLIWESATQPRLWTGTPVEYVILHIAR